MASTETQAGRVDGGFHPLLQMLPGGGNNAACCLGVPQERRLDRFFEVGDQEDEPRDPVPEEHGDAPARTGFEGHEHQPEVAANTQQQEETGVQASAARRVGWLRRAERCRARIRLPLCTCRRHKDSLVQWFSVHVLHPLKKSVHVNVKNMLDMAHVRHTIVRDRDALFEALRGEISDHTHAQVRL